jgi:hypothetical protein
VRTRFRIAFLSLLAVGPVAVLALNATPIGSATHCKAELPAVSRAGLSTAELTDLQRMADEDGTSLDEAISSFSWQDDVAVLATALAEEYPDDFAGAAVEDAACREASIAFKNGVPAEAAARIAGFDAASIASIEVKAHREHSVQELDSRLETVHMAVAGRKDLVDSVRSTYDQETGQISVEVAPKDRSIATDISKSASLIANLTAGLPAQARDWPVSIVIRSSVAASDEAIYGGE